MNKKAPPPSAGATRGEVRDSSRRGTGAAPSVTPIGATLGLALNKSAPPPSGATRGDASDRHKGLTRGDDVSGAAPSAGAMRGDALNRSAPPPSGATRGDFRSNSSMSVRRPRAASSSSSSINASSCWMSCCSTPSSPAAMMCRIKGAVVLRQPPAVRCIQAAQVMWHHLEAVAARGARSCTFRSVRTCRAV